MYPYLSSIKYLPMYGLLIALGCVLAFIVAVFRKRGTKQSNLDVFLCGLVTVCFGFIGAKLAAVIGNIPDMVAGRILPTDLLLGGFVFYGGLLGGFVGAALYIARCKLNALQMLDAIAVAVPLAQAFGRCGCFCAGCCYGVPTDSAIGVVFPENAIGTVPVGVPLVPVQLIEAAGCLALFIILMSVGAKKRRDGALTALYIVGYAILRFTVEFWRGDVHRGAVGALATSQFVSVLAVIAVALVAVVLGLKSKRIKSTYSKSGGGFLLSAADWKVSVPLPLECDLKRLAEQNNTQSAKTDEG